MKKIVLGCAAVLLSLGLLAGCNDDDVDDKINNTGPEENEPTDDGDEGKTDTGPGEVIPGGDGDGDTSGTVIKTGKLGFYSESLSSYYYFDGTTTTSSNREWGTTTTTWEDAIDVTLTQYDEGETLSWVSEGTTYYLGGTYDSSVGFEVTTTKTYINYNETCDSIETVAEDYFLGSYGTYTTMGWCGTSYYDEDYIAHVYTDEQKVPAPTSDNITISGPTSVYVGSTITLTATVDSGYDQSIVWSTESEYATVDESTGVVTGVAEGTATIKATSGISDEAYATYDVEVVVLPVGVSLLGSFDFSTNTKNGTAISSATDLDEFWFGEDLYRGVSEHNTVYLGNGSGGQFANETKLIKFGSGSGGDAVNGTLQLKFAVGTCISEVIVAAHSWSTNETDTLTINGTTQNCSQSGSAESLTYTITDDLERFITFESVGRVTIHSIDVYGTYEPEKLEPVEITLSADETEIMAGATTQISVSYDENAVFDVEDLVWTSNNEEVATVDENGLVTAVAAGEATITAACELTSSNASIAFTVTEATVKILHYSHTFKSSELGSSTSAGTSSSLNGLTWSYSSSTSKGWDTSSRGIQIGSEKNPQTSEPFTLSTDFGETVKLTSITLELCVASSGSAKYSITLGENAIATDVAFSNTSVEEFTHDSLDVEGQALTISLLATSKAMYIHGISMTIEASLNSSLTFN